MKLIDRAFRAPAALLIVAWDHHAVFSRLPGGGFERAYNTQAAVDTDKLLVGCTD